MTGLRIVRNLLFLAALVLLVAPGCGSEDPLSAGDRFLSSGDTVNATRCYTQALHDGTDKAVIADRMKRVAIIEGRDQAHRDAAGELMRQGDYLAAVSALQKAREIDPLHPETRLQLARALVKLSRYEEARPLLDALRDENVRHPDVQLLLARCHYDRAEYGEAGEALRRVLQDAPNHDEARSFLSRIEEEKRRIGDRQELEARESFRRGVRALYAGNWARAAESFLFTLSCEPQLPRGSLPTENEIGESICEDYHLNALYSNLVFAYQRLGRMEEALGMLVALNELEGPDAAIHYKIGRIYEEQGYWKQSLHHLTLARNLQPELPGLRSALGLVHKKMGNYDESIREFRSALDTDPKNPVLHYNLAIMYKKIAQEKQALEELEKVRAMILPGTKFFYTVEEHLENLRAGR